MNQPIHNGRFTIQARVRRLVDVIWVDDGQLRYQQVHIIAYDAERAAAVAYRHRLFRNVTGDLPRGPLIALCEGQCHVHNPFNVRIVLPSQPINSVPTYAYLELDTSETGLTIVAYLGMGYEPPYTGGEGFGTHLRLLSTHTMTHEELSLRCGAFE